MNTAPTVSAAYDFITDPENFTLDREQKAFLKHEAFHGNEIVTNFFDNRETSPNL